MTYQIFCKSLETPYFIGGFRDLKIAKYDFLNTNYDFLNTFFASNYDFLNTFFIFLCLLRF